MNLGALFVAIAVAMVVVILSRRRRMRIFFVYRIVIVLMIVMIRITVGNTDARVVAIMRFVIPMWIRGDRGVVVVGWMIVPFGCG